MKRAPLLIGVGVAALACCAQAFALGVASAKIGGKIVQPAGITIVSPLVLPTVTATSISSASGFRAVGSSVGATGTTGGQGPSPGSNATLTVTGQSGDAVSMAVPESFQVVRTGGTEALTVRTNTSAEYGLPDNGVVLAGNVMGGSSMSVNVGGAISLASNDQAAPGAYEGLLVVVVQYN
jgi:hypothetical protein